MFTTESDLSVWDLYVQRVSLPVHYREMGIVYKGTEVGIYEDSSGDEDWTEFLVEIHISEKGKEFIKYLDKFIPLDDLMGRNSLDSEYELSDGEKVSFIDLVDRITDRYHTAP